MHTETVVRSERIDGRMIRKKIEQDKQPILCDIYIGSVDKQQEHAVMEEDQSIGSTERIYLFKLRSTTEIRGRCLFGYDRMLSSPLLLHSAPLITGVRGMFTLLVEGFVVELSRLCDFMVVIEGLLHVF